MTKWWYIGEKGTFSETREIRIGSSDIAAIYPNPEKPTESLAAYKRTAITVYQEKRGEKERGTAGLAAEMGHFLENKALELFIRRFSGKKAATEFIQKKIEYEMKLAAGEDVKARDYQTGLYRHNTQYFIDGMIAHLDCIYIGKPGGEKKTIEGITVDLSKPFYIEAKSARQEATRRRDSLVKGYDFDLTTWQGIPMKHFVQTQFQSAMVDIPVGYLALLHNTSEFQIWRIDANKNWQRNIIDTVGKLLEYIRIGKMPREMAINQADIVAMYPNLKKDFVSLSGDQSEKVKELCKSYWKADQQEKNWKAKKEDAKDAISVHIKDFEEIRAGSDILAKWQNRKGSERLAVSLKDLKKNDPVRYRYLLRNDMIKVSADSRSVSVKWKGE